MNGGTNEGCFKESTKPRGNSGSQVIIKSLNGSSTWNVFTVEVLWEETSYYLMSVSDPFYQ